MVHIADWGIGDDGAKGSIYPFSILLLLILMLLLFSFGIAVLQIPRIIIPHHGGCDKAFTTELEVLVILLMLVEAQLLKKQLSKFL